MILLTFFDTFYSNPNKPVALDIPEEWPEFTNEEGKWMELNLKNSHVIDTPHRDRLHKFKSHVMSARRRMLNADNPPKCV